MQDFDIGELNAVDRLQFCQFCPFETGEDHAQMAVAAAVALDVAQRTVFIDIAAFRVFRFQVDLADHEDFRILSDRVIHGVDADLTADFDRQFLSGKDQRASCAKQWDIFFHNKYLPSMIKDAERLLCFFILFLLLSSRLSWPWCP